MIPSMGAGSLTPQKKILAIFKLTKEKRA